MALIKCGECGKEISDKAKVCPHCGFKNNLITCPECKKAFEKNVKICPNCGYEIKKENKEIKNNFNVGIMIWLIICVIACFGMAFLNYYARSEVSGLIIPYLAIILGISYIVLIISKNKINLYVLLGINIIVLLCSLTIIGLFIGKLNIACAIINSIITLLVVRKSLNNAKLNLLSIIIYVISLLGLIICAFLYFNGDISNKVVGSWIGDNNFEFDFYKDNKCHVKIPDLKVDPTMDDSVNILYSNCNYYLEDNKLTLSYDYSVNYLGASIPMNEEFVLYYDKDSDSFSNENGKVTYHRR